MNHDQTAPGATSSGGGLSQAKPPLLGDRRAALEFLLDNLVWLMLIVVLAVFSIFIPQFFQIGIFANIVEQSTFVGVMAIGGALGATGYPIPYAEIGIALSVMVLGLAVALRVSLPTLAAMALAGLFAIFHGHAHGTEMPADATAVSYSAGFMLATALLHGAGIAIGLAAGKLADRGGWRVAQAAGGAMALAGIALLANAG